MLQDELGVGQKIQSSFKEFSGLRIFSEKKFVISFLITYLFGDQLLSEGSCWVLAVIEVLSESVQVVIESLWSHLGLFHQFPEQIVLGGRDEQVDSHDGSCQRSDRGHISEKIDRV